MQLRSDENMGTVKRLGQVGRDASVAPFPTDWKKYINNMLVKTYFDQPNVARQMANIIIPLEYDGKYEAEIPSLNDLDEPEVGMEAGIADTEMNGDTINVKTPQIYQTIKLSNDKWAQVFAGQARQPLITGRMGTKIKNKEDRYTFLGKTGISSGIMTDATSLGSPSGNWGVATSGKLTNAQADFRTLLSTLDAYGVPTNYAIDVCLTSFAFTLLDATFLDLSPETSNRMMIEKMLRGGKIIQSDNIQDAPSSSSNSMFVSVRAPASDPGWGLCASGFDYEEEKVMWGRRVGVRQKVGYKVFNAKLVYKMTGITTAS